MIRATGAFLRFALVLALTRRESLRLSRRELPYLMSSGSRASRSCSGSLRLDRAAADRDRAPDRVHRADPDRAVGVGGLQGADPRRIWVALVLAVVGLAVVVEVWSGLSLDGLGVTAALSAAVAYAVYVLMAERAVRWRDRPR